MRYECRAEKYKQNGILKQCRLTTPWNAKGNNNGKKDGSLQIEGSTWSV